MWVGKNTTYVSLLPWHSCPLQMTNVLANYFMWVVQIGRLTDVGAVAVHTAAC
jgi:hypothetical protein